MTLRLGGRVEHSLLREINSYSNLSWNKNWHAPVVEARICASFIITIPLGFSESLEEVGKPAVEEGVVGERVVGEGVVGEEVVGERVVGERAVGKRAISEGVTGE